MSGLGLIAIRRVREATQGTTPAGNMTTHYFENFGLNGSIAREQPGNVRSDRQVVDNPATDIDVSGTASADVVYGDYDGMIEEAMANAMAAAVSVTASDIAAVASGNKLTGTSGSWASFAVGDFVWVSGMTTNGTGFLAMVSSAPVTTDLPLSTTFKTLVNESAGASITVKHAGRFRLGTSILTASYERLNSGSTKGNVYRGVGINSWDIGFTHPNKWTQSFGLMGMSRTRISAALANATTAATGNPLWNSNTNFGMASLTSPGTGFRFDGTLITDLLIQSLKITVGNPLMAFGGAGTLGKQGVSLDNRFDVKVDLTAYRTGSTAEDLLDDAADPATSHTMGFGVRDNSTNGTYFYLPALQVSAESVPPAQQSGKETVTLSYVAKVDSTHTMFQVSKLGACTQ